MCMLFLYFSRFFPGDLFLLEGYGEDFREKKSLEGKLYQDRFSKSKNTHIKIRNPPKSPNRIRAG